MGSVKDLKILKRVPHNDPGRSRFIFSDRYSIFDWGEMPDHIHFIKERTLRSLAHIFFEKLEKNRYSHSLRRACRE